MLRLFITRNYGENSWYFNCTLFNGKGGGNAIVTDFGINFIEQFHQLMKLFDDFLECNNLDMPLFISVWYS
jgi:hypothetical protein